MAKKKSLEITWDDVKEKAKKLGIEGWTDGPEHPQPADIMHSLNEIERIQRRRTKAALQRRSGRRRE
jgi:hypothetical protein